LNIVAPLIVFVTLGVALMVWASKRIPLEERGWVLRLLLIAFGLRVMVALVFELLPELRLFHEDANGYEAIGIRIADYWRGRAPIYPLANKNAGFFYVSAALAYAFGPFPLNVPMFNTIVGSLTIFLVYRLARKLFHVTVARLAAMLVAYAPSMILWSGIALKDALATCLIVIALSACVSVKEKVTVKAVLGVVVPIVLMQPIRFYIVYFMVFAVVISLALNRGAKALSGLYKQVIVAIAVVGLFTILGLSGNAVEGTEAFDLKWAAGYRRGMAATANSGYGIDADISTPRGALTFLPEGFATLLLAPFPWQMTSFRALVAAPETITWWLFVPATIRGILFTVRRKFAAASPLMLFMVSLTGVYSITQGNVGSAFRQRAQIFVFLFIFTAVGWYVKKCRRMGIETELLLRGDSAG
jgi:4-amino-4-deoxy-L-arabinose transferase-like glycosyltransferase